jgi:branched-subunit amino acid transport protein
MSVQLVGLALLMGAVTYPSRALPLLAPGVERLPSIVLAYLRLVGPSVLAALAVVNTVIATGADGRPTFHVGIEWLAVGSCLLLVTWRRNLFVGLLAAVLVAAIARNTGLA